MLKLINLNAEVFETLDIISLRLKYKKNTIKGYTNTIDIKFLNLYYC